MVYKVGKHLPQPEWIGNYAMRNVIVDIINKNDIVIGNICPGQVGAVIYFLPQVEGDLIKNHFPGFNL